MKGLFDRMELHAKFANRLREHGCDTIFDGRSSDDERVERIRDAIIARGLEVVVFGPNPADNGKAETYAQAFERCFGIPLDPKARSKRNV